MSFSRSLAGNGVACLALLAAAADAQKGLDEEYSASPGVVEGHQKQIAAITEQLTPALKALPETTSVSGSIWGHANSDQSGTYGFSLSIAGSGATEPVVAVAATT